MTVFLSTLHVMACLILIVVVLLQRGKGADMGAMLGGGGANTVFGSRGAGNFLTKVTSGCAIIFMLTSLSLAYLTNAGDRNLIFEGEQVEEPAPAKELQEIPAAEAPAKSGEAASPDALQEIPAPEKPAPDSAPPAP